MLPAALLAALLSTGAVPTDTLLARAESLLAAGRLREARRLIEAAEQARPDDPAVLILAARVHLAWPVFGRYRAESLLVRAARRDPQNPEPHYWLGHVGLALGGDDGEAIARRGLVRVLALAPHYRDAWPLWRTLYRGDGERREALRALAGRAGDPVVDLWRAELLLEQRAYAEAASLLRALVDRAPRDPVPAALLARLHYERGADEEGAALYTATVALADRDTAGVLWRQVRAIATPEERAAWSRTTPEQRPAFLRLFWARRDTDLRTSLNERVGEHFRRMARAQHHYRLLHPNSRYHRSRLTRRRMGDGLSIPPDRGGFGREIAAARAAPCVAELPSVRDARYLAGHSEPVEARGERSANLEDGLDDRGRIYVRHGEPDARFVFSLDGETWCYLRGGSVLRVTFLRLDGDVVVRPVQAGEAASARLLLATDRPDEAPQPLGFTFWPATFRFARDARLTELMVFAEAAEAVAVLIDGDGRTVGHDAVAGRRLRLVAPPGRYALLLDADRDGRRGRYRGAVTLPDYAPDSLRISSLLVADGATPAVRAALEAAAPPALRLPVAAPLRLYAEVYGLRASDGTVRYEARYVFERTGGGLLGLRGRRATTIAFERTQPVRERVTESLVVDPGRLARGTYRVRLEVHDRLRGARTASAVLIFTLD